MLLTHHGRRPEIDPSAYVAPNALVCGDVTVGPGTRILFGAQVVAESGRIHIGRECIVMENAVLRSSERNPLRIGNHCLVGPNAHVAGCVIEDEVFIATGAAIFHASHLGKGSEVRVHGVVHVETRLLEDTTVPIGWVAVGDPAQLFPPQAHDEIWAVQEPLGFPSTVYGLERSEADMVTITRRLSAALGSHEDDEVAGFEGGRPEP